MTEPSRVVEPKRSESDPPAANQPLEGDDLEPTDESTPAGEPAGEPDPTPVPVAAPHGGQVPPGKPDGEVDTRA
jgi:hypothetical protein